MTDTTFTDAGAARELALEPGTAIDIVVTSSSVRVRGTDEERLVVRNRDGDALGEHIRVALADGVVRIRDGGGTYKVGPFNLYTQHSPDLDIDVPRHAAVAVRTMSGDVEATGLAGDSRWASASGDIRLAVASGKVELETMSGDVTLEATGTVAVGARTVSGDVRVRARRLLALRAGSTSGDVRIEGDLDPAAEHAVNSVSGDVEVVTRSPVRLRAETLTGDVRATGEHVQQSGRGVRTLLVGDGSVAIGVRTTSGDVRLRALDGVPEAVADDEESATESAGGPARSAVPEPPVPPAAPEPPVAPPSLADTQPHPLNPAPRPIDADEDTHAWSAGEPVVDRREADRLEVLRALERGDLDIETAARRLETLEQAGPRYFRGWC